MVTITVEPTRVVVRSPFHPDFPGAARDLGGKWDGQLWIFDRRDEERVKLLCKQIYGWGETDLVTLHVQVERFSHEKILWLCGRQIARRFTRDGRVHLGEGVVVIAGRFASSGGSVKYPTLSPHAGTVLEIRDVPRSLVPHEDWITIIEHEPLPEPGRRIRPNLDLPEEHI